MTLLQEINAKTGKHSYTNQRFITNLFCALKTSPTAIFLSFVDQLKSSWIMEDISLPSDIIQCWSPQKRVHTQSTLTAGPTDPVH